MAIDSPCSRSWRSLAGDGAARGCEHCKLSVADADALGERVAAALSSCVKMTLLGASLGTPAFAGDSPERAPDDEDRVVVVLGGYKAEVRERVFFTSGSDAVPADAHALLDEVAEILQTHPELVRIEIQGHAEPREPVAIAEQRAEAVRAALMARGVEAARLVAQTYGAERPLAPNVDADGRAKNRRVEFQIVESH